MIMALEGLPEDLDGLRAAVLAMSAELAAERAERQRLEEQNERLSHFIRQLRRMQFGRRSEKLDPDPVNLALEDPCSDPLGRAAPEAGRRCPRYWGACAL